MRLGGFVISSLQERRNRISLQQKGTYRIMCLGESTTAGQYSSYLEEILNSHDTGIKFSVIDKGLAGSTTPYILNMLESDLEAYHPDMVISMMGINDESENIPNATITLNPRAIPFWHSLRVYKLARLLWLHMVTRYKDLVLSRYNNQLKPLSQRTASQPAEPLLKQAAAVNAKEPRADQELTEKYRRGGERSEAETQARQVIAAHPNNFKAYVWLAKIYQEQGKFSEGELFFKKAIAVNPKDSEAYVELARFYERQGKLPKAVALFKQAIAIDPKVPGTYQELAVIYWEQRKLLEAEPLFKQAIAVDPINSGAYVWLARFYKDQGKFSEVELYFKQAIAVNPKEPKAYQELAAIYREQGKFPEALALFKQAIAVNPKEAGILSRAIKVLYTDMGNPRLARDWDEKAKDSGSNFYFPVEIANYHKLKAILDKRGIVYVCMQYPMRSIEPLKRIFQDNAEGIIFLDNEKIFSDAVRQGKYGDYFRDMFGGDFGHCTNKGNRLLANNIANVILKEVFHR